MNRGYHSQAEVWMEQATVLMILVLIGCLIAWGVREHWPAQARVPSAVEVAPLPAATNEAPLVDQAPGEYAADHGGAQ